MREQFPDDAFVAIGQLNLAPSISAREAFVIEIQAQAAVLVDGHHAHQLAFRSRGRDEIATNRPVARGRAVLDAFGANVGIVSRDLLRSGVIRNQASQHRRGAGMDHEGSRPVWEVAAALPAVVIRIEQLQNLWMEIA